MSSPTIYISHFNDGSWCKTTYESSTFIHIFKEQEDFLNKSWNSISFKGWMKNNLKNNKRATEIEIDFAVANISLLKEIEVESLPSKIEFNKVDGKIGVDIGKS